MNILTIYSENPADVISLLDTIVYTTDAKVIASSNSALYAAADKTQITAFSFTFETSGDLNSIKKIISDRHLSQNCFVCEEDPADWQDN